MKAGERGLGTYLHAHPSPHHAGVQGHDLPEGALQELRSCHVQTEKRKKEGGGGKRGRVEFY